MMGFFEHQYLSFKKNHIRSLLALARADGDMHPKEEELLYHIGRRIGLKDRQIKAIVDSDETHTLTIPGNHNDKMNLIHDLILMIHADEKIVGNELAFLEDAVHQLGMKKEIVSWLLQIFDTKGTPPPTEEWEDIKKVALERFVMN
jgi:uncharacterized membrane protein YebE (DUF533 family)